MGAYASRIGVWAALMALLALTVALAFAPLGPFRLPASLIIATAKAALIYWVFMDLRKADGTERIAAVAAVVFLAVMIGLTCLDFAMRG